MRQARIPFVVVVLCALPLTLWSQSRATGTATIAGVVVSDDATPAPIRRAIVTIAGPELAQTRSTITDDRGEFTIANLPAGRFTITTRKPAYLSGAYGSVRPGRPGTALLVAVGQQARVSITMTRGGVIAGVLRNQQGRPWRDVPIAVLSTTTTTGQTPAVAQSQTTDDRGAYRFFGLPPGEYVVVASPSSDGRGEIGIRRATEMDALLADLQRRTGRSTSAPVPAQQPIPASVNFAPVYYPGSPLYTDAVTIRLAAAEQRTGLDFTAAPAPAITVEGVVLAEDGQPPASVQLSIFGAAPRTNLVSGSSPVLTQPPGPDGRFKYTNVPPDHYTIIARSSSAPPTSGASGTTVVGVAGGGSGSGAGLPPTPSGRYGYSVVEFDANASDVSGLTLMLHQGATLAGRLAFDGSLPVPADLTTVRVSLRNPGPSWSSSSYGTTMGPALGSVPPFSVQADGTFVATNIAPGTYQFSVTLPADAEGWWLQSAIVGGRDIADLPLVVKTSEAMETTLRYADRRTEISGTLQNTGGRPAPEYFVLVFTSDRTQWRAGSRRIQVARPGSDGRFSIRDLPPGEYILVALNDLAPGESGDPNFLDQAASAGTRFTLGEGERKVQDYKIAK